MAIKIYNVTDLQNMNNDLAGDYELANDIDASGVNFTPLGGATSLFTGSLDGKGYKITGLTITTRADTLTGAASLIARNKGTVQNLGIEDCAITVSTTGQMRAAAITYDNTGLIQKCWATGVITVSSTGLVWCSVGGIATFNTWDAPYDYYGEIKECWTNITISATSARHVAVGGGVAYNWGKLGTSYALGSVSATSTYDGTSANYVIAGGLVAENGEELDWPDSPTTDCYAMGAAEATGVVTGQNVICAAGLIGRNIAAESTVINSFSTGQPTSSDVAGGLCASNAGTITDCFWDAEKSGVATSDGGTGKTTAEMKEIATFSAWDIDETSQEGAKTINNGYPFLSWQLGSFGAIWLIYGETIPPSPRKTVPVEDIITLQAGRNVEMAAHGRIYVDEEGNLVYNSRYARNK